MLRSENRTGDVLCAMNAIKGRFIDITTTMRINIAPNPCQKVEKSRQILQLSFSQNTKQLASKTVGVYPSYTPPPAFPPYARIESHFPFNLYICSFTDMKKRSRDLFLSYRVSLCHSNVQL